MGRRLDPRGRHRADIARAALLVLAACASPPLDVPDAQTDIAGRVTDARTGAPVVDAMVSTTPGTSTVRSASDGAFRITNVRPGQYQVRAGHDGYESATVAVALREGGAAIADVQLRALAPELAVSPATVDLGATLSAVRLSVQNRTGMASVAWRAASEQPWLAVSPAGGTVGALPVELTLAVDRAMLPPGASVARLVVTSDAGTRVVEVRVEREDPAVPRLLVSTSALAFDDTARTLTLDVANGGAGTLTWRATSAVPWLSVEPASGTGPARLRVTADRAGLPPGEQSGALTILSNGGTATIAVRLAVGAAPPAHGAWAVVATFPGMRPTSVSVAGPNDVWVGGSIRATDGGVLRHWDGTRWTDETAALSAAHAFATLSAVDFRADGTGVVVGTNVSSRMVVARRQGARFVAEAQPGTSREPYATAPVVALAGTSSVWAAGYGGLLHHFDGAQWTPLALGTGPMLALRFGTSSDGWALEADQLYRFDGTGWTAVPAPVRTGMRDLAILQGRALLATATGTHQRGPDGVWTELRDAQGRALPARRVAFMGATSGWLLADTGPVRWYGGVFTPVTLPAPSTLVGVAAAGGETWAVGYTGDYANGYTTIVYRHR